MSENIKAIADRLVSMTCRFVAYTPGEWPHFMWRVSLQVDGRTQSFDYKMGVGHCKLAPAYTSLGASNAVPIDLQLAKAIAPYGARVTVADLEGAVIPTPPRSHAVLLSVRIDVQCGDLSHSEFCDDLGYDAASISARDIWLACVQARHDMRRLFGGEFEAFMCAQED